MASNLRQTLKCMTRTKHMTTIYKQQGHLLEGGMVIVWCLTELTENELIQSAIIILYVDD